MALDTIDRSPDQDAPHSTSSTRSLDPGVGFELLAARLAEFGDDEPLVASAWSAIVRIEQLLGIHLGDADESLVVLWRRFARTHRTVERLPVTDPRRAQAQQVAADLLARLR